MAQEILFSFAEANLQVGDVLHVGSEWRLCGRRHICFCHNGTKILQSYAEASRLLLKVGFRTVFLGTVIRQDELNDLVLEVVELMPIKTDVTTMIPIFETR